MTYAYDLGTNSAPMWYKDADHDNYGSPYETATGTATPPTGYVGNNTDCDDTNAAINPTTIWYRDLDADSYGSSQNGTITGCVKPDGYILRSGDCNDNDSTLNPETIWFKNSGNPNTYYPQITSCSQPAGYTHHYSPVGTGPGSLPGDCVNANGEIFNPETVWYYDGDTDGYGDNANTVKGCTQPANYVSNNLDCNDGDISLNPDTTWYQDQDGDTYGSAAATAKGCTPPFGYVRNSNDYNDGTTFITNIAPQNFYHDGDGDGFGNPNSSVYYSVQPTNYVTNNLDCEDSNAALNPNTKWYLDADTDSYGSGTIFTNSCTQPAGYVGNLNDFDDGTANITNIEPHYFYLDSDGDGFGNPNLSVYYSVQPANYVSNNSDCDDGNVSLHPNTLWYSDADNDGYGSTLIFTSSCTKPSGYILQSGDYDDQTSSITNIEPHYYYQDTDGDGFGNPYSSVYYSVQPANYVTNNSDYDDTTTNITNIAPQHFYLDQDGDGFGNPNQSLYYSNQPPGYINNNSDYDDTTLNITNIAPQFFYHDSDGDGFGNNLTSVYYSLSPTNYVNNNMDCNDNDFSINPNTKWYADSDSDGFGDPSNYLVQCTKPAGNYVLNNTDNCPIFEGTSSDCESLANPLIGNNYMITKVYKKPSGTPLVSPTPDQALTNVTYFDGLGRPIQQIARQSSSSGKDIVTHIEYDALGRKEKDFLPYATTSTNMEFQENAATDVVSFYNTEKYGNTSKPFSQKRFEASPLSRILKQSAPGNSWEMDQGHEIKMEYQTNIEDEVRQFSATSTWDESLGLYEISLSDQGNYPENVLYKNVVFDENTASSPIESAGSIVEFKNKEGQVVLKRTYESGTKHDTYYVYDITGNLTYVIPPMADGVISNDVKNNLCYQYKYDYRNRLVEKKIPGKQWQFIVYDKLDRIVATGPALSPFKDDTTQGWLITKYDVYSRPIYTGWSNQVSNSVARKSLQDTQNNATALYESKTDSGNIDDILAYYSNLNAPTSFNLLTVNYYDNYNFPNAETVPASVEEEPVLTNTKNLSTGNWIRVLTTASEKLGETTTIFYDENARTIRTHNKNYLTGHTYIDSKLDFTGNVLYTVSGHERTSGSGIIKIKENFNYSEQGRLLSHTNQINDNSIELLADNTYDELGQLLYKKIGNNTTSPLQKIDFSYNVRGWLTEINKISDLQQDSDPADLFAFKLNYNNESENPQIKALYNGNIAETFWKTGSDNIERGYGYQYDKLNRLTNAIYEKNGLATNAYGELLTYDKNGNIESLLRNGGIDPQLQPMEIDHLTYNYTTGTNQLKNVVDEPAGNDSQGFIDGNKNGDDFGYDDNGNLTSDKNKNITEIQYNHLNLPKNIIFGTTASISYIYNAVGQKLEKIKTEESSSIITNYLDGFQYKDNVLQFFPTAEGYVYKNNNGFAYVYHYKDHLGNIRLSYTKNPTDNGLEIIDENNYYPFGLNHIGYNPSGDSGNADAQKYKYNGKEFQTEADLNITAMDFRMYDNALGRFYGIDALAESMPSMAPNHFGHNNPVFWADPSGLLSASFAQSLWDHSPNGKRTLWENSEDGSFFSTDVLLKVDAVTGVSTKYEELREITVQYRPSNGTYVGNLDGIISSRLYSTGRYYESWRSKFRTRQFDDFQEGLDYLGAIPVIGEPVDLVNAGISALRGNYVAAGLSLVAVVPVVGWAGTALKIQKHHIIPRAVFRDAGKAIQEAIDLNGGFNLKKIPFPFHGNHPQYNIYVAKQLENLKNITPGSIKNLQKDLNGMINNAYDNYKATGENLNDYFRKLND